MSHESDIYVSDVYSLKQIVNPQLSIVNNRKYPNTYVSIRITYEFTPPTTPYLDHPSIEGRSFQSFHNQISLHHVFNR